MITKLDFKALRLLPYFTAAVLLITALAALLLSIVAPMISVFGNETAYKVLTETVAGFYFVKYIAVILLFLLLYGLSAPEGATGKLRPAWLCCVFFLAGELVMQVAAWFVSLKGDMFYVTFIEGIFKSLPDYLLMLAVLFMLTGFASMSHIMKREREERFFLRIRIVWSICFGFITLFYSLLVIVCRYLREEYDLIKTDFPYWTKGIALGLEAALVAALVGFVLVAIQILNQLRNGCYEYYLYMYNKGK